VKGELKKPPDPFQFICCKCPSFHNFVALQQFVCGLVSAKDVQQDIGVDGNAFIPHHGAHVGTSPDPHEVAQFPGGR
jgi:hypothetical protein